MLWIAIIEAHLRTYIQWLWVWHSIYVAAQSLQGDLHTHNHVDYVEVKKAQNHWVILYLSLHSTMLVPNVSVVVVWQSHFDFFLKKTLITKIKNNVLIWANLKLFWKCFEISMWGETQLALWKVVYYSNKIKTVCK